MSVEWDRHAARAAPHPPGSGQRQNVIIYADHLLPASETFIRSQAQALKLYEPWYVGSRRVAGLDLPPERTTVVNRGGATGRLAEAAFKAWGISRRLRRDLRALSPALVHAHFGIGGVIVLPVAIDLDLPLVVTFHGFDVTTRDDFARQSFFGHRLYLKRRKLLMQEADCFIAVSDFIADRLRAAGYPEDRIHVHYIGIDLEQFTPVERQREPIVLFVARMVEKKGGEQLIRAMAEVQRELPAIELVLVGDGPLRTSWERIAAENLRRFRFTGMLPQAAVKEWLNRAMVFCVPSATAHTGDSEGLGMVFLEAQAMATPVAGFFHGGVPEAVRHGETGLLAPEGDIAGLKDNLLTMLRDGSLRYRMGKAGRERVQRKFDIRKQTRTLETLYDAVLRR